MSCPVLSDHAIEKCYIFHPTIVADGLLDSRRLFRCRLYQDSIVGVDDLFGLFVKDGGLDDITPRPERAFFPLRAGEAAIVIIKELPNLCPADHARADPVPFFGR